MWSVISGCVCSGCSLVVVIWQWLICGASWYSVLWFVVGVLRVSVLVWIVYIGWRGRSVRPMGVVGCDFVSGLGCCFALFAGGGCRGWFTVCVNSVDLVFLFLLFGGLLSSL